ncbi:hypothetical protein [Bosea minatitlanensis]|uniref:Uncharacterized protein n=1 Tax=Bosea minatitlanensis TaxID=128782 RepID=A0ABW0F698_9HYPH|nr:hypothetical protein [Bosea minatitlanensis]
MFADQPYALPRRVSLCASLLVCGSIVAASLAALATFMPLS